jgi:hypothetical protein
MADPESSEAAPDDKPTVAPDYSANALRREPATIEGEAQDLTAPEPQVVHEAAEEPGTELGHLPAEPTTAEHTFDPLPDSETAPDTAQEISAPPADTTKRRGGVLVPSLLALIIGGAAGFGGAYGLRFIDKWDAKYALLGERVDALEQQQKAAAALTTAQADLANRVTAIETQAHDDSAGFATLRGDIERLTTQKPGTAAAGAPADLGPLKQQLSALQDKLSSLTAQVGDLGSKLAAQQNQVVATQHLATQVATAHAGDEAAAIIAGSLLRKAEAGAPFADDLSALESRGIDKAQLANLQAAGASGVATAGELSKQFAAVTDAILATAPAPKTHGFLDRLMKDAEGLVRVRRIGDTTGDSLAAHVARIQNALDAGSVETAYQQWKSLPDAAKQKSQAFGQAAKTRIDTIAAARAIESDALASLGKAKS